MVFHVTILCKLGCMRQRSDYKPCNAVMRSLEVLRQHSGLYRGHKL